VLLGVQQILVRDIVEAHAAVRWLTSVKSMRRGREIVCCFSHRQVFE
jgi:hypothetical protein